MTIVCGTHSKSALLRIFKEKRKPIFQLKLAKSNATHPCELSLSKLGLAELKRVHENKEDTGNLPICYALGGLFFCYRK